MLSHCRISCSFCLSSGLLSVGAAGAVATVAMSAHPRVDKTDVVIMPGFDRSGTETAAKSEPGRQSSVDGVEPGERQGAECEHREPRRQRRRDVLAVA